MMSKGDVLSNCQTYLPSKNAPHVYYGVLVECGQPRTCNLQKTRLAVEDWPQAYFSPGYAPIQYFLGTIWKGEVVCPATRCYLSYLPGDSFEDPFQSESLPQGVGCRNTSI
ncbi:unnamed protein product, partial [Nezara viridula]